MSETVDVAVGVYSFNDAMDLSACAVEDMAVDDLNREPIGVGDEVYFPGLFGNTDNLSRVIPIVRYGNVAMMPTEKIQVKGTFADVYLVEARSMLGMSGSPVFVRESVGIRSKRDDGRDVNIYGLGHTKLLGMMQGHWDVSEAEINQPHFRNDPRGVNLGIAIVVPAAKILEIINIPELVAMREHIESQMAGSIDPTSESNEYG
jgi:hypothetical protein